MKKSVYGFSIVELMVSLVLGSMLTLAAVQLFGVNQRTFVTQQSLTRVLDDGQLALRFLSDDIRKAGYSGGAVANDDGIVDHNTEHQNKAEQTDHIDGHIKHRQRH